jgi:hypothetical protein
MKLTLPQTQLTPVNHCSGFDFDRSLGIRAASHPVSAACILSEGTRS